MQNAEIKKPTTRTRAATAAVKAAPVDVVEPSSSSSEPHTSHDVHAEAIKKLEAEIEGLKVTTAEIKLAMEQKLKMYVKLQFGAMSLLGMFNIFG